MVSSFSIILVAGLFATLMMDLASHLLYLLKIYSGPSNPTLIGRWFCHNLKGNFSHANIAQAHPFAKETSVGMLFHYGIGIVLAFVYAVLLGQLSLENSLLTAGGFGVSTNIFPWFWLFPSYGFGLLGLKGQGLLLSSFLNHLIYGLSLYPFFSS